MPPRNDGTGRMRKKESVVGTGSFFQRSMHNRVLPDRSPPLSGAQKRRNSLIIFLQFVA
jgi:hypothetical protein